MTEPLRDACRRVFDELEIVGAGRVRIQGEIVEVGIERMVPLLQLAVYLGHYACLREVAPPLSSGRLLQELRSVNALRPVPRDTLDNLPQNYIVLGNEPGPGSQWLRLYWNVGPLGALALVRAAVGACDRDEVPFQLKVMLDTGRRRRDAAVLYVPTWAWQTVAALLGPVELQVRDAADIEDATPLFARRVCPGVAIAEDPGGGESFGTHRSGLFALALASSYLRGARKPDAQWQVLREQFESAGLALDRPHLNSRDLDPYAM